MSSSYSREAKAKFELDKAEKEIFENAKDFEDLFFCIIALCEKERKWKTLKIGIKMLGKRILIILTEI